MSPSVDVFGYSDYQEFLLEIYQKRKLRNGSYSLRAFSKSIGLQDQAIGNVIAGRYGISGEKAEVIANHLELTKSQTKYFVLLAESKHARSIAARRKASREAIEMRSTFSGVQTVANEESFILEKWYISAVLELIPSVASDISTSRIAKRLGITELDVSQSLEILTQKKFIEKLSATRYARMITESMAESATPSATIRGFHKQLLEKAIEAVDAYGPDQRRSLSSVFSFDTDRMEEAREELRKFQASFLRKYTSPKDAESVYSVTLQLFRLDRAEGN